MRIERVFANNRKKVFVLNTARETYEFPYSELELKPSSRDPISTVWVDSELAHQGFSYRLSSGKEGSIVIDAVLEYHQDPEYLCDLLLHNLTVKAIAALREKKISKRQLARKLKTSPRQLYRLLNPAFYGKTIDQMVKLLHALGQRVELKIEKQAA